MLNRSPTKSLDDKTPYEAWTGIKPNVDHLRVFGCLAHVKIVSGNLKKLEDKSKPMAFIGYEKGSKAYRVYDPFTGKIHLTGDVIFEESVGWNWENIVEIQKNTFYCSPFFFDHAESSTNCEESQIQSHLEANVADVSSTSTTSTEASKPSKFKELSQIYVETRQEDNYASESCHLAEDEPIYVKDALKNPEWKSAMDDEMKSIMKNETWKLVSPPKYCKPIGLKWVFKIKRDQNNQVQKYKARLVVKGYAQRQGKDYDEIFAPVARIETIRIILVISVQFGWLVYHLDVKTAFLNGEISEDIYVQQPEGYEDSKRRNDVYKLHKALYGLKQAPRAWYFKLDKSLTTLGLKKSEYEPAVYYKNSTESSMIVGVYVDDLLLTGSNEENLSKFKLELMELFEMTDLQILATYLGIHVIQGEGEISLNQSAFAKRLLEDQQMMDSNPSNSPLKQKIKLCTTENSEKISTTVYRSILRKLRYLTHTRLNLMFSIGLLSRFMENPSVEHLKTSKRVMRYVKGTLNYGLKYKRSEVFELIGYSDSDYAGDYMDRKSTSRSVFFLGENLITWSSQEQKIVALSSCEAEYIALNATCCQAIWLAGLITELTKKSMMPMELRVDNSSAIELAKNPAFHIRTKHIDVRYHYSRMAIKKKWIKLKHVPSEEQLADIMTKVLGWIKFVYQRSEIKIEDVGKTSQA